MKENKRLTNKVDDYYNCNAICSKQSSFLNEGCLAKGCGDCKHFEKILNRLGELEDKIENGTLIELPCEIKNIREIEVKYKDYGNPLYAIVQYYWQQNEPYKIVEYHIVGKGLISGKDKRVFEWCRSMNFGVVEDGFISKEQAEARLKELKGE